MLLYREAELLNPPPLPLTAAAVFSVCYTKGQVSVRLRTPAYRRRCCVTLDLKLNVVGS